MANSPGAEKSNGSFIITFLSIGMKKNIYVLLGVFALLIVVAYFMMNRPGENDISIGNSQFLVDVDSVAVDKIEIKSPKSAATLEKKGAEWSLSEPLVYRANQSSVTSLIHQIKNLAVKEIVSSNPEKRPIFQVDSTGTLVKVFQGGQDTCRVHRRKTRAKLFRDICSQRTIERCCCCRWFACCVVQQSSQRLAGQDNIERSERNH